MIGLRAANVMLSVVVILLVAALFYKDYASLIRNNKSVVKMLTPSNFVAGTIKYAQHRYFHQNLPLVKIGEDAHLGPVISSQAKKTLVILVVGETARAENFSLGGYSRRPIPARSRTMWFISKMPVPAVPKRLSPCPACSPTCHAAITTPPWPHTRKAYWT